jgi:hypothetical protein
LYHLQQSSQQIENEGQNPETDGTGERRTKNRAQRFRDRPGDLRAQEAGSGEERVN